MGCGDKTNGVKKKGKGDGCTGVDGQHEQPVYMKVDPKDARQWFDEHFQGWVSAITPQERAAVQAYRDSLYRMVNGSLARDKGFLPENEWKELIENLDSAIQKCRLPHPMVFFRGGLGRKDRQDGEEVPIQRFMSTSLTQAGAERFLKSPKHVLMEIRVPAGTPIAPIGILPGLYPDQEKEFEILLPRGYTYRIVKANNGSKKRKGIDHQKMILEVIPMPSEEN